MDQSQNQSHSYLLKDSVLYYSKGWFRHKWVQNEVILYSDGTIYRAKNGVLEDQLNIFQVFSLVKIGNEAIKDYGRPSNLPNRTDTELLVCLPKTSSLKKKEMWWILFNDSTRLNNWVDTIQRLLASYSNNNNTNNNNNYYYSGYYGQQPYGYGYGYGYEYGVFGYQFIPAVFYPFAFGFFARSGKKSKKKNDEDNDSGIGTSEHNDSSSTYNGPYITPVDSDDDDDNCANDCASDRRTRKPRRRSATTTI